jgi:hypothetical protein
MPAEFPKRRKDNEFARAADDRFVFEVPGVLMRNVNGVEADFHSGINVAALAVADHPTMGFYNFVFVDQAGVSDGVFFRDDLDGLEKSL